MNEHTAARQAMRCIITVVDASLREALDRFLAESGAFVYYQTHGIGTANSDFLNLCGLGDTNKTVTISFAKKDRTAMLLAEMKQALGLQKRGTGIAVSIPLGSLQGWMYKLFAGEEVTDMNQPSTNNITHAMLVVSVNQGFGDDVMRTARAAGATGGTILRGLRCLPEETAKHFGISVQEEMEIVMIVVSKEARADIMSAISSQHGIDSPAHGIVVALPVDGISGL